MKRLLSLALSVFAIASAARCQNAALMPVPKMQFFDANGYPLTGGLVYTCVAGSSCPGTPLATYTDSTAGTPNANPVVLDAGGFASIWLGSSAYKITVQNSAGVTQWTQDNVQNNGLGVASLKCAANGLACLDSSSHVLQSELNYNQGGTGAVNRTVQNRLQDFVSVKDFGAAGNGSTDDTAAINAAIAAAPAASTVYFPAGTYKISSTILISKTLTLIGAGSGALNQGAPTYDTFSTGTRLVNASTSQNLLQVTPSGVTEIAGLAIRDIAFEGNRYVIGATAGDNIVLAGGASNHVRNALLENVTTFHAYGNGLTIQDNTYGSTFLHMMVYNNKGSGIVVTATNCTGSPATNCTGIPSSLNFDHDWVDQNQVDGLQINAPNASDVMVDGGFYADSNTGAGINITSAVAYGYIMAEHVHVEENHGSANVLISGGCGNVISDSQIQGDSVTQYGVYVDNNCANAFGYGGISATLRNNVTSGHTGKDIYITSNGRNVTLAGDSRVQSYMNITDNGANTQYLGPSGWNWGKPSSNGSITFSQSGLTQNETVTFPNFGTGTTGTFLFGFSPNTYGTGVSGVGAISSQSVASGACVNGGSLTIAGYQVGMALAVAEIGNPGAFFTLHYGHSDATHFQINECNASATAQTIAAVSFYVRVIQ